MNLPNKLTMLRIVMIPLYLAAMLLPVYTPLSADLMHWIAALLFVLASVTDALDGNIARKRHLITDFGKFMDPIADKLLTCSAMVLLTYLGDLHPVATILFIGREFLISGFRLIAAAKGTVIAADKLGKLKTVLQIVFLVMLTLNPCTPFRLLQPYFNLLGQLVMLVALFFSILSGIQYIRHNKGVINFHDR